MKRRKLPEARELELRAADAVRDLANAAVAHHDEIEAIATQYHAMKTALTSAIQTVDWLRSIAFDKWTPADSVLLEEWRRLVS